MPYFGEVREFATGTVEPTQEIYCILSQTVPVPVRMQIEQRIWTGSEWAPIGSDACNKALAAIRDDTHDPLAQPGALR